MAMSERIGIANPEPGEWTTLTQTFATSDRSQATADLGIAVVRDDARNLSVTPDLLVVTAGQNADATVHWKGLIEGPWYGAVEWRPGVNTLVTVEIGPQPDLVISSVADAAGTERKRIAPIAVEVNREGAEITVAGLPAGVTSDQVRDFSDVPVNRTFFQPISWATETKVSTGCTDGTFRSSRPITRAEVAAQMHR